MASDVTAISMWQPWASLLVAGRKLHETRPRRTSHRGWLVIQAAKRFCKNPPEITPALREVLADEFGGHWAMDLPTGAIIGAVHIVDCQPTEAVRDHVDADDLASGDWRDGRFAWKTDKRVMFKPVPWLGSQGFFYVPARFSPEPHA